MATAVQLPSAQHQVDELLKRIMADLRPADATSTLLYMRDATLPHYLRLVSEQGVTFLDPMFGPLMPDSPAAKFMLIPEELRKEFWFSAADLGQLSHSQDSERSDHSPLDTFVRREDVHSSVLFNHYAAGHTMASLWVNFRKPFRDFPPRIMQRLRKFNGELEKLLGPLRLELTDTALVRIQRFECVHNAAKRLPPFQAGILPEQYLDLFLRAALTTLNLEGDGIGSVYLLDDSRMLRKVAQRGPADEQCKTAFSVDRHEGVISWAVIRKSPLLVRDPAHRWGAYYHNIDGAEVPPTVQQLVVPLMIGTDVIGVINLESKNHQFVPTDVFDVCRAAIYVAGALRVAEQTGLAFAHRSEKLLNIATRAAMEEEPSGLIESLQEWASGSTGAARCNIWPFDCERKCFFHDGSGDAPRRRGFSRFIQENHTVLWLKDAGQPADFNALKWNDSLQQWQSDISEFKYKWIPDGMNAASVTSATRFHLGLPILFRDECCGVLWLKFAGQELAPPVPSLIRLARGVAAEIGLVLQMKERHREFITDRAVRSEVARLKGVLFPDGPFSFEGGEGYVIHRPKGDLGGDFYRYLSLPRSTAFIVGDGVDHGIQGACNMLPLVAAFNAASKSFASPKHTLWQMGNFIDGLHSQGTAICFVIDCSRDKPRLVLSSAGDQKIVVVKKNDIVQLPRTKESGFTLGQGQGKYYDNLLEELTHELDPGDTLIVVTDGVLDAGVESEDGRKFGMDGVYSCLDSIRQGPQKAAEAIEARMLEHCDSPHDDYTILVIVIK
jgi:serine phosphatase RsbU (regulator of sigma subunit)